MALLVDVGWSVGWLVGCSVGCSAIAILDQCAITDILAITAPPLAGLTTEAALDAALTRALTQLFGVGLFDPPSAASTDWSQSVGVDVINGTEHRRVRHDAALQSIVRGWIRCRLRSHCFRIR